jgi:hypothetical protein
VCGTPCTADLTAEGVEGRWVVVCLWIRWTGFAGMGGLVSDE